MSKILLLVYLLIGSFILPVKGKVNSLPTEVQGAMITALYSERSEIGDRIEVKALEPLNLYEQRIFIPINAIFVGKIDEIQEAGRGLIRGKAKVSFQQIVYPNGYTLLVDAVLGSNLGDSIKGKSRWTERFFQLGKVGVGALVGGPVGAAVATGTLVFDKGGKLRLNPGETVEIKVKMVRLPQVYDVKGTITDTYSPPIFAPSN